MIPVGCMVVASRLVRKLRWLLGYHFYCYNRPGGVARVGALQFYLSSVQLNEEQNDQEFFFIYSYGKRKRTHIGGFLRGSHNYVLIEITTLYSWTKQVRKIYY